MNDNELLSNSQIFRIVMRKYLLSVPEVRFFILTVFALIIPVSFLEIRLLYEAKNLTKTLTSSSGMEAVLTFVALTFMIALLSELHGIIFANSVHYTYRYTLRNAFSDYIKLDTKKIAALGTGVIHNITERKSRSITEMIEVSVLNILPRILGIILTCIAVIVTLGLFSLFVICGLMIVNIYISAFIINKTNTLRNEYNNAEKNAANLLYDSLTNHETVVSYSGQNVEVERYDSCLTPIETLGTTLYKEYRTLLLIMDILAALESIIILLCGARGLFMPIMTVDQFTFYLVLSKTLQANLNDVVYTYFRFTQAMIKAKESFSSTEVDCIKSNTITDCNNDKEQDKSTLSLQIDTLKDKIEFKNVYLSHSSKEILKDASFTINKGDKVALLGSNGSGKSSLLKTFLRFNEYQGQILIDGTETSTIANESFRNLIAYVPQNPALFCDTVMYNIKYGNFTATDEEVYDLSKKYNIHKTLVRLDDGYQTNVGPGGSQLSGGERQKVALLRGMLKGASILVMDEPTSAMDKNSETEILTKILKYSDEMTVIAIVHNNKVLPLFNKFCILNKGSIKIVTDIENDLPECFKIGQ